MRTNAILLALLLASAALAQEQHFRYPKSEPGRVSALRGNEYRQGRSFDLYRPSGGSVVPVVIFANVGGAPYQNWGGYQGWGDAVANAGMAAVLYQASADPTGDFDALVAALQKRAAELKIDPSRIVVWSGSANVQVGLPLAMDRKRDYIRGAVVYYGVADVPEIRTDLPVLLVRAGLDTPQLNDPIDRLVGRALAMNAPWSIESYGSGLHAFDIFKDNDITRLMIERTLAFMKAVTRPEMARAYAVGAEEARIGSAFNRAEWQPVIEWYTRRVAEDANDGESHRRLGIALTGAKRFAEGLEHLEKAWQLGRRGPRDTAWPASEAAAGKGDVARTVYWLDILLGSGFGPAVADVRTSGAYEPVKKAPEFELLLAGIEEQQRIFRAFESGRSAEGLQALRASKNPRLRREGVLNAMAYGLLQRGKRSESIEFFRFVTELNPGSANAWDSLSEAYEAAGDRVRALESAQKALQLIEKDASLNGPGRESIRAASAARIERMSKGS